MSHELVFGGGLTKKHPYRFAPRVSLKVALILITAFAVWLGWFVMKAKSQQQCVAEILQYGGGVIYSHSYVNGIYNPNSPWPGPEIVRKWLGKDYVDHVIDVDFDSDDITRLPDLDRLPKLKSLSIYNTDVKDLSPAAGLKHLESLRMDETQIADLNPIRGCKKLNWINIAGSKVTDLSPLFDLPVLKTVVLFPDQITAAHLEDFVHRHPNCKITVLHRDEPE